MALVPGGLRGKPGHDEQRKEDLRFRTSCDGLECKALDYMEDKEAEGNRIEDYYAEADAEQGAPSEWYDPGHVFGLSGQVREPDGRSSPAMPESL